MAAPVADDQGTDEAEIPGVDAVLPPPDGEWFPPPEDELEPEPEPLADQPASAAATLPAPCGEAKLAEVLAPATAETRAVSIACQRTLRPEHVVTTQLILQGPAASGVTVDCNGALLDGHEGSVNGGRDMIEIRSRKTTDAAGTPSWARPENVTVRDCRIVGSMRIWGMGKNGEAPDVRESSRREGHVTRVRDNAPRRIVLENLTITGVGRTPLYLAPGVTYVTLSSSELAGEATSVGLYLDAESSRNVIRNNTFRVTSRQEYVGGIYTRKREEIAIDGSSYNQIIDNRLSTLEGGGIYLYRNCGEGGTVRHSQPSHNQIINNVFYYDHYDGDNPAVFLGSRDNSFWEGRFYCGEDSGFPWGSSSDDRSFARYNAVMQNQIYKRTVPDMIRQGDDSNRPNYIAHNQTVESDIQRRAGCYVATGYKNFILDGQSIDVFRGANNEPRCTGTRYTCADGDLTGAPTAGCSVERVPAECQVIGSDAGCRRTASCPAGRRIVGAVAACNLEYGAVSDAQLAQVPVGSIAVVRASDNVADGRCTVGDDTASSGRKLIDGVEDLDRVTIGCSEHDRNGGDCHIKAAIYCR